MIKQICDCTFDQSANESHTMTKATAGSHEDIAMGRGKADNARHFTSKELIYKMQATILYQVEICSEPKI